MDDFRSLGSRGGSRKQLHKVQKVRRRVELSTTYMAEILGVSRWTVKRMLEDGRLKGLTPADLYHYALHLPVPVDVGNNP